LPLLGEADKFLFKLTTEMAWTNWEQFSSSHRVAQNGTPPGIQTSRFCVFPRRPARMDAWYGWLRRELTDARAAFLV
jgi:hypothetical protein